MALIRSNVEVTVNSLESDNTKMHLECEELNVCALACVATSLSDIWDDDGWDDEKISEAALRMASVVMLKTFEQFTWAQRKTISFVLLDLTDKVGEVGAGVGAIVVYQPDYDHVLITLDLSTEVAQAVTQGETIH